MDALARGRRPLLSRTALTLVTAGALASLVLGGCGAKDGALVGVSRATVPAQRPASADHADPKPPAAIPADYKKLFAKLNRARFMSKGHSSDRFAVDVYANDKARKEPYEPGATLVMEHWDRTGEGDKLQSWLLMEKREKGFDEANGDWRWAVVESDGRVVKDGRIDQCVSCHEQAPRDHVFPILD